MSELEPEDSRVVTNTQNRAPGEPPRTGPREDEARAAAGQSEQGETRGEDAGQGLATEGDSPAHPDRFSGAAAADSDTAPEQESDRGSWRDSSE